MNEIQTSLDADGVLLARIDMPGRSMNVFSQALMDALDALIDRAQTDSAIRAVVLTSGKSSFLAGADLDMIRMFTERAQIDNHAQRVELCGRLGRIFRRLEMSTTPFVAAINGLALGGGLEVCMACHARIVADDPDLQLGLPEIKLGLLPGAGGTQRLPRLIGAEKGLAMLLSGQPVGAREAMALGLVEAVVAPDQLLVAATQRALALAQTPNPAPWDVPDARFDSGPYDFKRPHVSEAICDRLQISDYQRQHYPAYQAIIDCVADGWSLAMTEACNREMDIFVDLIRDPVAGNMVRTLFLNRQRAAKAGLLAADSPLKVGDQALLPRLIGVNAEAERLGCEEPDRLLAVALVAVQVWGEGRVGAPELADVAAVAAGVSPAYSGGPFTYLHQQGVQEVHRRAVALQGVDIELFQVPDALERFFAAQQVATHGA
ncbi:TPA: enoyl-CoA hydratase/isomerase family protein [Pseudomonas aeruginosa]|nr:enoyl-CoA hydratase/isomerase family protein [Pseudomonas aeruginosa]HEJ3161375.1 enoyl-CoA hydratase/isomerase family protein [Pseudomonas aeruginosa]